MKAGTKITMGQSSKSRSQPKLQSVQADDDAEITEDNWPSVARLRVGGLSQQGRVIREVCRDAIRIVEVSLVTVHAWPELHQGTLYKRHVLLEAVNTLRAKNQNEGQQDSDYEVVRTRILKDERFIRTIGKWVRIFILKFYSFFIHNCPLLGNRSAITSSWRDKESRR